MNISKLVSNKEKTRKNFIRPSFRAAEKIRAARRTAEEIIISRRRKCRNTGIARIYLYHLKHIF